MLATLSLRPRQRAGLVLAIVALSIALGELNRDFRFWLRDHVLEGTPSWLDNMLIMIALGTVVWGLIGLLLLGPRGMGLGAPERPRRAWVVGVLSGLGAVALGTAALSLSRPLVWQLHPDWPMIGANVVSNFEEELIHRGAVQGLLTAVLGRERAWTVTLISAALFCQGHRHYPLPLLLAVFAVGLAWAWMALRYRSIWPSYAGHMVADAVGDTLIKF
jgi:membrane protease YdiL (CAAX protease family)